MQLASLKRLYLLMILLLSFCVAAKAQAAKTPAEKPVQLRSVTILTEPGAVVWMDDLRYGRVNKSGTFNLDAVSPGSHRLRIRADGFKETVRILKPAEKGEIKIALTKTTDPGELAFQEAERLSSVDRDAAIAAYRKAISLRPAYAPAHISLARTLSDAGELEAAAKAIRDLRRIAPRNAEASAVEGRILKESGDEEKAIAAFKRAIAEGRGVQPEAYTGLGLLYKERAEGFGGAGDLANEAANYDESAKNLKIALKQLGGAPDALVLYQLLGLVFERQQKYNEAIALYRQCLQFFPNSNDATAIRSFIEQLQKKLAEQ